MAVTDPYFLLAAMLDFDKLGKAGWINLLTEIARAHRRLFGRDLALTQELGELHACDMLDLERAPAGTTGNDAIDPGGRRVQIKSRAPAVGKGEVVNAVGRIGRFHNWEFDYALLVLLDSEYRVDAIWRAEGPVLQELQGKLANARQGISVASFIKVAHRLHRGTGE